MLESMKRSLSLDFLRGFAIWMMVVFHVFEYSWSGMDNIKDPNYVLHLSPLMVIVAIIVIQLAMWAGLFILISCCVNVISMQHRIDEGSSLRDLRNRQIYTGFLVLILGYLTESIISYNGFIGYSLSQGKADPGGFYHGLLTWKALQIIGLSIMVSSVVVYELYKDNGHLKVKRNISVLACLAVAVLILTPVINWTIRHTVYSWWSPSDVKTQFDWPPQSFGELLLRLFLVAVNGYMEPIFPFLTTAFIGVIFGIVLSQENPDMEFPVYAMLTGFLTTIFGIVLILLGVDSKTPINFRTEIPWFMISLGGQIFSVALLLYIVEFHGHVESFTKFTTFWRRWGMMALSIYCLQIIDFIPKIIVYVITGERAHKRGGLDIAWTFLMIAITIIWFEVLLRIWSKRDFKYSLEWIIVNLTTRAHGFKTSRMQVKSVVYDIEPMKFQRLPD